MREEELKKQEQGVDYNTSWFALTPNRLLATLGVLKGEINCDICIVGGGFTGLSAALELSKKGYSVTLLEARTILESAAGKNGGHIVRGFLHSPARLAKKFGPVTAKFMCDMTLEGLAHILQRIAQYDIKCDLKFGHVTTAIHPGHVAELKSSVKDWAQIGHKDLQYFGKNDIGDFVKSPKYIAGVYDPKGAHFHPLNYALGIAQAAQATNCKIYDESPVIRIQQGNAPRVFTEQGVVNAKFVIIGGHIKLPGFEVLGKKVITATAHMIATEPLSPKRLPMILPRNSAVTDASFHMNFFRFSPDNRILFGGNCTYTKHHSHGQDEVLKKRMVQLLPELKDVNVQHYWKGPMDVSLNRLPHMGRLGDNIYFAHGYCGHNIILGNLAGILIAEAVSGTAERFDVFAKIRHTSLLGGDLVKRPVFALDVAWKYLQDLIY